MALITTQSTMSWWEVAEALVAYNGLRAFAGLER